MHRQGISKYWSFPTYLPMGSRKSMVSLKNVTVINFAQCHAHSRVSIGFSCTDSKFQNTGHSQCICPWEVVRARFCEKCNGQKLCESHAQSRVSINFSCTVSEFQNSSHSQCIFQWKVVRAWFR
ncbi:hypothetical protein BHE74_00019410 [Ensete ventricosum]|nr:hypothetical protein GW17_00045151 [Ensete ventricosum]RWW72767.1 hypothetical protein BHE74_00019410 [Ensete ventricosum]RZS02327.1 hypothetical protein BHM03_00032366 [Ensete ventricosum]